MAHVHWFMFHLMNSDLSQMAVAEHHFTNVKVKNEIDLDKPLPFSFTDMMSQQQMPSLETPHPSSSLPSLSPPVKLESSSSSSSEPRELFAWRQQDEDVIKSDDLSKSIEGSVQCVAILLLHNTTDETLPSTSSTTPAVASTSIQSSPQPTPGEGGNDHEIGSASISIVDPPHVDRKAASMTIPVKLFRFVNNRFERMRSYI
jgi:hypothetical protein